VLVRNILETRQDSISRQKQGKEFKDDPLAQSLA
jgi:hypothetical protein